MGKWSCVNVSGLVVEPSLLRAMMGIPNCNLAESRLSDARKKMPRPEPELSERSAPSIATGIDPDILPSRFRDDHIPRGVTQKKAPTEAGVFCCAVQA
jgi:hypothetical protein